MRVRNWSLALARSLYRRDPTPLVLQVLRERARRVAGEVTLPIGRIRYVDGASCASQYEEIFFGRAYEFDDVPTSPLILDCGSHIGLASVFFARRYPGARIRAFEADPTIAAVCRRNVDSLGLQGVVVTQAAVWNTNGQVRFSPDGSDAGHVLTGAVGRSVDVPALRLADLIVEPVDLLKMDVEGSEFVVIDDLDQSGKLDFVRAMVCELHVDRDRISRLPALLDALHRSGLRVSMTHARPAPDLPGQPEVTPFRAAPDGRWLAHLYAWRRCEL